MAVDQGLATTREVRERISREHGNDPHRLVAYYLAWQERFADRLRRAPEPGRDLDGPSE
jgi:hypothetical protein